ncbi:guanine nucleotide-binding protein subunit gamma 2 [Capsicum chacoense]
MESSSASQEENEVQTNLPSSVVRPVSRTGAPNNNHNNSNSNMVMGKHRLAAAIAALNQQIHIIQEELDQLDSCGEASLVCRELVSSVELIPDALLPVTRGPINVHLDRWFHGANDSRRNKRWI